MITFSGYCGNCGAYVTEIDGSFYVTISRTGEISASARCQNSMVCQENRDTPHDEPL